MVEQIGDTLSSSVGKLHENHLTLKLKAEMRKILGTGKFSYAATWNWIDVKSVLMLL